MLKNIAIWLSLSTVVVIGSYYWGYQCGKQEAHFASFDRLLVDLSDNILMRDALEIGQIEQIQPLAISKIESDFALMVQLYEEHEIKTLEHIRCAVSRRIRQLKRDKQIMSDEEKLREADFPIDKISSYLKTECLGEPSHLNWAKLDNKNP